MLGGFVKIEFLDKNLTFRIVCVCLILMLPSSISSVGQGVKMKSLVILIISTLCINKIHGFSSGKLPLSVCDDMKPGPPHGENQVSQKEDLDPPFSITATKEGDGFVLGNNFINFFPNTEILKKFVKLKGQLCCFVRM